VRPFSLSILKSVMQTVSVSGFRASFFLFLLFPLEGAAPSWRWWRFCFFVFKRFILFFRERCISFCIVSFFSRSIILLGKPVVPVCPFPATVPLEIAPKTRGSPRARTTVSCFPLCNCLERAIFPRPFTHVEFTSPPSSFIWRRLSERGARACFLLLCNHLACLFLAQRPGTIPIVMSDSLWLLELRLFFFFHNWWMFPGPTD